MRWLRLWKHRRHHPSGDADGGADELVKRFEAGEVIVREGAESTEMYILQQGRVEVSRRNKDGEKTVLSILTKGDFFGEMSLLESLPRAATVTALEPVSALVIQSGGLLWRIRRDPTLAIEIMQSLSGRIRHMDEARLGGPPGSGDTGG